MHRILDRALGIRPGVEDRLAVVEATAGVLADYPDWPEWLASVRGPESAERLRRLGL
ncbi:MAG TPA: hypothetical protein VFD01_16525 [Candidatus Dormibacteraeota bacterium]|nr:hypothetical protein [Candidatus Dormibacteraeota bacterium]